jgi:hypothetical protein
MGTQDTNRHGPGNIGYTRYKQTRASQHWVHKIQTDTGLATLGTQDKNRHWHGNIGYTRYKQTKDWPVFILCTQCCQASICFYLVYPMLPGPRLFVSCVPNVAMPVSVFILCTQCCQARVCLYLVYPMLPGHYLFARYKQTLAWQHWVHKIQTDDGLATLGTQDKNRYWPGNIGCTR